MAGVSEQWSQSAGSPLDTGSRVVPQEGDFGMGDRRKSKEDDSSNAPTPSSKSWRPAESGRFLPFLEIPEQGTSLEGIEKELIEMALKQAGGNQTRAAHLLSISRDTLRYRVKKFELAKASQKNERPG